jgi:hypothetical protein
MYELNKSTFLVFSEQRPIDPGPSGKPAQGVDSYIKSTVEALPQAMDKIWKIRLNMK